MTKEQINPENMESWLQGRLPLEEAEVFAQIVDEDPELSSMAANCRSAMLAVRLLAEEKMRARIKRWKQTAKEISELPSPVSSNLTAGLLILILSIACNGVPIKSAIHKDPPPIPILDQAEKSAPVKKVKKYTRPKIRAKSNKQPEPIAKPSEPVAMARTYKLSAPGNVQQLIQYKNRLKENYYVIDNYALEDGHIILQAHGGVDIDAIAPVTLKP